MQKTKLILFSYDFPPSNGGIARLCQEIAVGMKSHYEEVVVLTRKKEGPNIPYNSNNLKIIELPNRRVLTEIAAFWFLLKIKNKSSYDILCGLWHPEGFIAIISGFKNTHILGHGTEFLSGTSKFKAKFWLPYYAKFVLKRSKIIIANSHYTKGLIKLISKSIQCEALPLAVNHDFFKPNAGVKENKKLKLCSVSRIQQFKGHDFVLKTLAQLPQELKNKIEWHIAGVGSYLIQLKKMAIDLNLSEQVFFHGFVKDELLPEFYSQADVFILCTREEVKSTSVEGFGLVFLEAQACGVPVIGTNTGGIPDAIEPGNGGWLIEQDNEEELTQLVKILLIDKSITYAMGDKARKRIVEKCTREHYCFHLNEIMK